MAAPLVAAAGKWAVKQATKQATKQVKNKAKSSSGNVPGGLYGVLAVVVVITLLGVVNLFTSAIGIIAGAGSTSSDASCGGASATPIAVLADIPAIPLAAYQKAGPASGIDWTWLAAIGKIESNHGTYMGRSMAPNGDVTPPVIGPALDGSGRFALIRDTDNGQLDNDTVYDRAVGPMQFIPTSWKAYGGDGNGDGVANPNNYYDAVVGSANHLVRSGGPGDMNRAILGYNNSTEYLANVTAQRNAYVLAAGTSPVAPAPVSPIVIALPSPVPAFPGPSGSPGLVEPVVMDPCGIPYLGTSSGFGAWGGYSNGMIPLNALAPIPFAPGQYARPDAVQALVALNAGYVQQFGANICITDSYRSYAEQVAVKIAKPGLAATPGSSNHGWGLALDLCGGLNNFGTTQHNWFRANAPRYGWVDPSWARQSGSMPEAWHWEFHGTGTPA